MSRDTPPGHRRFKFHGWRWGHDAWEVAPWSGEPGDVIVQHGRRLGQRFYTVVDVEPLKKWTSVLCRPALDDEATVALNQNRYDGWRITATHIEHWDDLRQVLL